MVIPSVRENRLNELVLLVEKIKESICDQYIKQYSEAVLVGGGSNKNLFMGGCVILNYLLNEKLIENGFKTELVAGQATFGINKNQFGVVEYGYDSNMSTLTASGDFFNGNGFLGHCWIKVQELNVVIDLTLMHLKEVTLEDNLNRGIFDDDYLLDTKKMVITDSEIVSRNQIVSGEVGYHYNYNPEKTKESKAALQLLIK